MSLLVAVSIACFLGVLSLEWIIRALGIHDFPLFVRDPASIYRMRSSQRGRFMKRHSWYYNRFGMRHMDEPDSLAEAVVILGDSVVDGGNQLDQRQTLAALVAMRSQERVYPVACHGWAIMNELGALTAIPGWQNVKHLVWFINSGDIDTVGQGESEFSFPTRRPTWLFPWLVSRHIYRRNPRWWPWRRIETATQSPPDVRTAAMEKIKEVVEQIAGSIIIVLYPMRDEQNLIDEFFEDVKKCRSNIEIFCAADIPGWGKECYIDKIHPNAHGVLLLSEFVTCIIRNRES